MLSTSHVANGVNNDHHHKEDPLHEPQLKLENPLHDPQLNQENPHHDPQLNQENPHHDRQLNHEDPHHDPQLNQENPHHNPQLNQVDPHHDPQLNQENPHHNPQLNHEDPLYNPQPNQSDPLRDPQFIQEDPLHDPHLSQSDPHRDPRVIQKDPLHEQDDPLHEQDDPLHEQDDPLHEQDDPLHNRQLKQRCDLRGKEFEKEKGRNTHKCSETCQRPQLNMVSSTNHYKRCNKCGKTFSQMSALFAHSKFCKIKDASNNEANSQYLDDADSHNDSIDHRETIEPGVNKINRVMEIKTEPNETDVVKLIRPNSSSFIKVLPSLKHDDLNHNVTLVSSDRSRATCHAAVVAAASSYLAQLLRDAHIEDENALIVVENMSSYNMKNFIDFLYMGTLRKSKEEVNDLKRILEELKIKFSPETLISNDYCLDDKTKINDNGFDSPIVDSSNIDIVVDLKKYVGHSDQSKRRINELLKNKNLVLSKCKFCGRSYSSKNSLDQHMKNVHSGPSVCTLCNKSFTQKNSLDRHMKTCDLKKEKGSWKKLSKCRHCGKSFSTIYKLKYHMRDSHKQGDESITIKNEDEVQVEKEQDVPVENVEEKQVETNQTDSNELEPKEKRYKCLDQDCHLLYNEIFSETDLKKHSRDIHNQPIISKCDQCDLFFNNRYAFVRHTRSTHKNQNFKCTFANCGTSCSTFSNLQKHSKRAHNVPILLTCQNCEETFTSKFDLIRHQKNHVRKRKIGRPKKVKDEITLPVLCNLCGSIFQTEFEYKKHNRTHKPRLKKRKIPNLKKKPVEEKVSYLCNICGQNFTSRYKYKGHINKAHIEPEEQLTCPHCPTIFVNESTRKTHIQLHLPPTIQCHYCEMKFRTNGYLRNHIKTKHTAENLKDYVCGQCGKGFISRYGYEGHLNMHAGLKPFKCRYCDMCYQNKSNRHAHEKKSHPDVYVRRTDSLGGVPIDRQYEFRIGLN